MAKPAERILSHVALAPPLKFSVGPLGFTQDIAVVEVDPSKIDASNFRRNIIDLSTEIDSAGFTVRVYSNIRNRTHFKYPTDRLLKLRDIISVSEMRHPGMVDQASEECIVVIKNGKQQQDRPRQRHLFIQSLPRWKQPQHHLQRMGNPPSRQQVWPLLCLGRLGLGHRRQQWTQVYSPAVPALRRPLTLHMPRPLALFWSAWRLSASTAG